MAEKVAIPRSVRRDTSGALATKNRIVYRNSKTRRDTYTIWDNYNIPDGSRDHRFFTFTMVGSIKRRHHGCEGQLVKVPLAKRNLKKKSCTYSELYFYT